MTPQDLLAVSPEFLAKAILYRRERIVEKLPDQIAKRHDERQVAGNLARDSKAKRDDLNTKVANLKKERDDAQSSAETLIAELRTLSQQNSKEVFGGSNNSEAQAKKSDSQDDDVSLLKINEMQSMLHEHQGWASKNIDSKDITKTMDEMRNQAIKLLAAGQKAHFAMIDLSKENNKIQSIWLENEAHRRRCESRYTKLSRCKKESDNGIEFWSEQIKGDFNELLIDAKRVSQGGLSSRTLMKQRPSTKHRRGKN